MQTFSDLERGAANILNALLQALPDAADELVINSQTKIFFCRGDAWIPLQSPFATEEEYWNWVRAFLWHENQVVDLADPVAGGVYRGFRWHGLLPPLTQGQPVLAFRRMTRPGVQLSDFGIGERAAELLRMGLLELGPCAIFGPTAAGKSTLLLCLLREHLLEKRVTILQRGVELPDEGDRWVFLTAPAAGGRRTLRQLFQEVLRLRPEAICFSELRGLEAAGFVDAFQALSVPIITTLHGSSVDAAWSRLTGLVQEGMVATDWTALISSLQQKLMLIELGPNRRLRGIYRCDKTRGWRNLLSN